MAILKSLNDDGLTVVIVTHEPEIAAQTRRVITMLDGKVVSDTVKELPELVTANEPD